jgi:hypothetical protein
VAYADALGTVVATHLFAETRSDCAPLLYVEGRTPTRRRNRLHSESVADSSAMTKLSHESIAAKVDRLSRVMGNASASQVSEV